MRYEGDVQVCYLRWNCAAASMLTSPLGGTLRFPLLYHTTQPLMMNIEECSYLQARPFLRISGELCAPLCRASLNGIEKSYEHGREEIQPASPLLP